MKNLRTYVLCAGLVLTCRYAGAQEKSIPVNEPDYNRPRLFQALPEKIQIQVPELNSLLQLSPGDKTSIRVSADSRESFDGEILSAAGHVQQPFQTVIIRSSNFPGATLSITRSVMPDGTSEFRGRIISFKHGDLYDLEKQNGNYILVKKNFYDLVNE